MAYLILTIVTILIATLLWYLPGLTRPDLYFAVTVPLGFRNSAEGHRIGRRYRMEVLLAMSAELLIIAVSVLYSMIRTLPVVILLELAAVTIVFWRARRRVLLHSVEPTTIREADMDAEIYGRSRIISGNLPAASVPFLLLSACAVYLWVHWAEIPARFAIHFGAGGQPDRWVARSFTTVYSPLVNTLAVLAVFTLILVGVANSVQPIHAGGAQGKLELRFRRNFAAIVLGAEYIVSLQASWSAASRVLHPAELSGARVMMLFPACLLLIALLLLARLGQGGTRIVQADQRRSVISRIPIGDRIEDRYWKLGILYFNPHDPAALIEIRFGLGYTLNFARPVSWIILIAFVMSLLVPLLLARQG